MYLRDVFGEKQQRLRVQVVLEEGLVVVVHQNSLNIFATVVGNCRQRRIRGDENGFGINYGCVGVEESHLDLMAPESAVFRRKWTLVETESSCGGGRRRIPNGLKDVEGGGFQPGSFPDFK